MATMAPKRKKRRLAGNSWPARLRAIRERMALTQAQAGEKVGVSVRSWLAWEVGDQIPSRSRQILLELLEKQEI